MRRFKQAGLSFLIGVMAFPIAANAWWSWNRHEVLQVSNGVWEVVNRVGSGPQDYWCAIGDFAISGLRTKATQRIYIWRGIGPSETRPGRKAVQFSLSPPSGADTTPGLSLDLKKVGDNLNAATARNYCYDRFEDSIFRRF